MKRCIHNLWLRHILKHFYRVSSSKVCLLAEWPIRAGAYPGFCGMKRLGVFFLLPPWIGCQLIAGLPPAFRRYQIIRLGGERHRESKEHNTLSRPGPEPGPLDPESSTLTMRPPRLPHFKYESFIFEHILAVCRTFVT